MNTETAVGILIPFLGTALGSAGVLFMKDRMDLMLQRALAGFAAGVMVAASIWSLLIPAMEQSASMGKLSFVPAAAGFWIGILFLLLLDRDHHHLCRCDRRRQHEPRIISVHHNDRTDETRRHPP